RIAKFLAHRVIGAGARVVPLVQCQRDHQGALLGGEAGERSVGGREDVLPEERIQRAPRREPFATCAAGRIGQRDARVAGVEGGDPRDARRLQARHGIAPGPPQQVPPIPARGPGAWASASATPCAAAGTCAHSAGRRVQRARPIRKSPVRLRASRWSGGIVVARYWGPSAPSAWRLMTTTSPSPTRTAATVTAP